MLIVNPWLIEPASFAIDGERINAFRQRQLSPESAQQFAFDGRDQSSWHVIAQFNQQWLGWARMSSQGFIDAYCLHADAEPNVLRDLLQSLIDTAKERKLASVSITATHSQQAILQALGFVLAEPVDFAALATQASSSKHLWRCYFPLAEPIVRSVDLAAQRQPLVSPELFGGKTHAACLAATLQVLSLSKRDIAIYSRDLEPTILGQSEVILAIRQIALRAKASVRILLQDSTRAVQSDHRLVDLVRRLPSVVSIRKPQDDDLQYTGAFIVGDQHNYLERQNADQFECEGNRYDIARHGQLWRYFNEVWERSPIATEFRQLGI